MEARHEPKRDSGFFGTAVSLTGRAVRLIAAVGCAAIPLLVQAGSTNLPMRGGGGGTTFTLDCGDDEVLIGASGRRGQWIDQIRGRCIKVTNENTWAGSVTTTARRGNNNLGTTGFTITCPRNTAVKRISGRFGWYVHRISLRCVPLGSSGTSSTITASGSSAGPTAFGWDTCPDNKPARGFRGASGSYIHRIGLVCHSGTTPTLQVAAAPTNLVAVNLVTTSGPSTTSATPFVQFQWIDRSTFESGYRVVANPDPLNSLTASRRRSFDRPAARGVGSRQALTVTDLATGNYFLTVCAKFSRADGGFRCTRGPTFRIQGAAVCSPTITSAERIGAATGRVNWSHSCNNPTRFNVMLRCGTSPFGVVAMTGDGTARSETFNFGVGSGVIQVCAIYPNQTATAFCSAQRSFQCN